MNGQYALDEAALADLIAEPGPFNDYLNRATDYTVFRGQLRNAIDYMLQNYGLTHDHAGRAVSDNEAWRQSSREELAERIAIHLCAGLSPQMEQHNYRAFIGALELIKQQRAIPEASGGTQEARESCPLCGGAGVVPGTEEPETNTAGEPCDCVPRGER